MNDPVADALIAAVEAAIQSALNADHRIVTLVIEEIRVEYPATAVPVSVSIGRTPPDS